MPWIKIAHNREILVDDDFKPEPPKPRGPAIHGVRHLTERERLALFLQTGREMETTGDLYQYCKEDERRVAEPGDWVSDNAEEKQEDLSDAVKGKNILTNYMGRGKAPERSDS